MSNEERIMIFIDHNNIFREFHHRKLKFDYVKLRDLVCQNRNLVATKTYMGIDPAKNPQKRRDRKRFFDLLRRNNIIPITKIIRISPEGDRKEKEIDIALASDLISYAYENKYDKAILVSGDGDYRPAIEKIIAIKKKIEIWSFKEAMSTRLGNIVHYRNINFLNEYLDQLKL